MQKSFNKAKYIIANSSFTKKKLAIKNGIDSSKIKVINPGKQLSN